MPNKFTICSSISTADATSPLCFFQVQLLIRINMRIPWSIFQLLTTADQPWINVCLLGAGKSDKHHRVKLMVGSIAQYYKTYLFGIHFQQVGRMSVIESVSKLPLRWSWIHACLSVSVESKSNHLTLVQGGITCGAIEEASISSKTIDKHVIINFSFLSIAKLFNL